MKALDTVVTPIHKEGHFFVAAFFLASLGLFFLFPPLGWAGLVLTLWCVYFFRDPERVPPEGEGLIVSPGDGVVSAIAQRTPPAELKMGDAERTRISVFLNVFNVHVNRTPMAGEVTDMIYVPGLFVNAADDDASDRNERQLVHIKHENGQDLAVVQVAGLVARRIICDLKIGDTVGLGDRYGLIRFGSRMDIYLPVGAQVRAKVGQIMTGGETVIAELSAGAAE